jgi:phosphate transport system permease protein
VTTENWTAANSVTTATNLPPQAGSTSTTRPTHPPGTSHLDRPREVGSRTLDDWLSLIGSGVGSLAMVWLLFNRVLPFSGLLAFLICWYLAFLMLYTAVTSISHPRPAVIDRIASAAIHAGAGIVGIALVSTVVFTFYRGASSLPHLNFYTQDMKGVRPTDALSRGGVWHAVVGSLIEIGIAIAVTLPLGVGTAVFMTEVGGRFSRLVRIVVEAMTALPSIVAGLFVYTLLILTVHFPKSGFAAAMAISVMMLPIIARAADVVLRIVPGGLREAGLALGSTHWRTVWHVVLPTARPGLATALILGVARGVGETSPVLLTSGASTFFNANPFGDSMNSLPLYIYTAVRSGQPIFIERGFGAASVLLALVLVLFIVARRLARQRGQRRGGRS